MASVFETTAGKAIGYTEGLGRCRDPRDQQGNRRYH
jgi:hypothetical protein